MTFWNERRWVMEVGERLRLEIFYCSGHGWIPDAGLPFLVLWVWVSFGYACVSGHLPSDMALGKFLPRAESQKESPVPALPLEASGEPIASQSGCSRNSSLDRSILSRRNGPELGSRIMTSKRVYHKYQGLTGAGRELKEWLNQTRILRPPAGKRLVQDEQQKPAI